jgi:hypothetical protein
MWRVRTASTVVLFEQADVLLVMELADGHPAAQLHV